jgi:hypothetical protein
VMVGKISLGRQGTIRDNWGSGTRKPLQLLK